MEKKMMTMVAAVAAVAVIVAAGAFVMIGNDDKGSGNAVIASQLQIRGNANDDYTIDNADMAIVKDVADGIKQLSDYPLADVNGDGKVDSTDISLLQDLIDRKNGCKAYVVCLDRAGEVTTVECTYPLRNVVPYGTNMQEPVLYANAGQYVAGYFVSSYDVAEKSINADAVDLKGTQRQISDAAWKNFTELDTALASKEGIGALLVDYSGISQITDVRYKDLRESGIPMITYSSADATAEITTVLTLGFLFGGECEQMGVKYAQASWNVMDEVKQKVDALPEDKKVSYIACTMYIYVCGPDSSFNSSAASAGGIPYSEVNPEFKAKYTGNSTKMASTEALSNYKDAGSIINNRSMDWGLDADEKKALIIDTWSHENKGTSNSTKFFEGFEDKLVYIDNLLPGAVKVAYMAHAMYGDIFDRAWADGILQEFIDMGTAPLNGQTLDTILAYIDVDTYNAAKT